MKFQTYSNYDSIWEYWFPFSLPRDSLKYESVLSRFQFTWKYDPFSRSDHLVTFLIHRSIVIRCVANFSFASFIKVLIEMVTRTFGEVKFLVSSFSFERKSNKSVTFLTFADEFLVSFQQNKKENFQRNWEKLNCKFINIDFSKIAYSIIIRAIRMI